MSKTEKKIKTYDVVDVYRKLRREFPQVKFIVDEVEVPIGLDYYTFFKFKLKRYYGQEFEPPIKTTISISKNNEINENEYNEIRNNMILSFGQPK